MYSIKPLFVFKELQDKYIDILSIESIVPFIIHNASTDSKTYSFNIFFKSGNKLTFNDFKSKEEVNHTITNLLKIDKEKLNA